eukprot:3541774-Amphidinium_carterae.1
MVCSCHYGCAVAPSLPVLLYIPGAVSSGAELPAAATVVKRGGGRLGAALYVTLSRHTAPACSRCSLAGSVRCRGEQ